MKKFALAAVLMGSAFVLGACEKDEAAAPAKGDKPAAEASASTPSVDVSVQTGAAE